MSKQMKHTPGPWTVDSGKREQFNLPQYQRKDFSHVVLHNEMPIAEMRMGNPQANARLIAAAPEMLEALQYMIRKGLTADAWRHVEPHEHAKLLAYLQRVVLKATGGAQ